MDSRERLLKIVRQFPENSMKLLLENPSNVRDLLLITASDFVRRIDFDGLRLDRSTFVQRDYRHVESDVVLTAPFKFQEEHPVQGDIVVYILIEHQSHPDRIMPLRLLNYVVQIYRYQESQWAAKHVSLTHLRLQPVLPVVLYTGLSPWGSPGRLVDLVELGHLFGHCIPVLVPLFLSLRDVPPDVLESQSGFFGWVLRLVQRRKAPSKAFQHLLKRVIQHLESMPARERLRWLELLSYIHALVYHQRDPGEMSALGRIIEAAVKTDEHRQELSDMGKTYAEVLREEGREEGLERGRKEGRKKGREEGELRARRNTLLRQLRNRFGEVSPEMAERIEATGDIEKLDDWLDRILTASSIEEMGI